MLNHLIESDPQGREMHRRGSFFLCTLGVYALLFFVMGLASIYAYDARLETQSLDLLTLIAPAPAPDLSVPFRRPPAGSGGSGKTIDVRRNPTDDVNHPENVPPRISTSATHDLAVRRDMPFTVGPRDLNADTAGVPNSLPNGSGSPDGEGNGRPAGVKVDVGIPPPSMTTAKVEKPRKTETLVMKSVLNGRAISLPKPPYPQSALISKIHGEVPVQVLIDENGKVLSARAVSGSFLLRHVAEEAALHARFSPTLLGGEPVRVSGIINYNFTLE